MSAPADEFRKDETPMEAREQGRSEYGIYSGEREVTAYFTITDGHLQRSIAITGRIGPLVKVRNWTAFTIDRDGPTSNRIASERTLSGCLAEVLRRAESHITFG